MVLTQCSWCSEILPDPEPGKLLEASDEWCHHSLVAHNRTGYSVRHIYADWNVPETWLKQTQL